MAKFDFNKPVASFSWYLQNGSADDKRGNRLHVGTGQKAQIYFDPESGEFIGKLKYVDDYIDLADGAKQHFELPRTAREYKPSDFSPKFPISNVKFEVDESVKDLSTSCRAVSSSTRMNSTMPSSGTRRTTRNHLRIFSSPARATSRPPVNSMEQSKSGRRASTAPSWKSAMSKTVPFRNMRTIGFCRSTTIKSCWRPLKIISDAERVITGRQAT